MMLTDPWAKYPPVVAGHHVYGLFIRGKLVYIGTTPEPHTRLAKHRNDHGNVTMRVLAVWLTEGEADAHAARLRTENALPKHPPLTKLKQLQNRARQRKHWKKRQAIEREASALRKAALARSPRIE